MIANLMNKHGIGHCNLLTVFFLVFMAAALWGTAPAAGEIYRWQDEQGNWHYTDSPTSHTPSKGAYATEPSQSRQPPENKNIKATDTNNQSRTGLLWRVYVKGREPSYLLGTIHSEDSRVTRLKPSVARALDDSQRFIMEMQLDTNAFMHFGTAMLLTGDEDLESIVGKKLFAQLTPAMANLGMPEPVVRRMKPWVVMAMLSMPKPRGGLILDMVLYQRATGQGKPTSGLETAEEQLSVFDGLSRQDQIALLEMTLKNLPAQQKMIEALIEAYAADDLDEIIALAEQNNHTKTEPAKRFMARLNDERNQRMVERMIPYLKQGNSFIAVGALHLGGPKSLLTLLKKHGYNADAVR